MQKIVPHLWFDKEAEEAARFYAEVFPDSKVNHVVDIPGTPSGDSQSVTFTIAGYEFMAISAGPLFKINPSVSFHFKCPTPEEVDKIWGKLKPGGTVRMELGEYPFSKRYGWIEDKYGVSWQLIHADEKTDERITPVMLFTGDVDGKCEEAVDFYASVFGGKGEVMARHDAGGLAKAGSVAYAHFVLFGQGFGAMDGGPAHDFDFNEAVSYVVSCEDQDELDRYWDKLSAVPEAEQCGWLKDKYGFSWQIVPKAMEEMMGNGTPEQIGRVTQAFLKMKKFDIAELRRAFEGK